jgi:hypothetical protein
MIDHIRVGKSIPPQYEAVGIWVQGFGPGLDIEMFYKDTKLAKEREQEVSWVINRLVDSGQTSLDAEFIEYHQKQRSPYDGVFSQIVETDSFTSMALCARSILG